MDFPTGTVIARVLRLLTSHARETPIESLEEVRTEEYI